MSHISLALLRIELLPIYVQQHAQSTCGHAGILNSRWTHRVRQRHRRLVQAMVQDRHAMS